jgi:hypothetical protein
VLVRRLFRATPALPVSAMQTYAFVQSLPSHWRPATCAEVDCPHYLNGWETRVPVGSELTEMARSLKGQWSFVETREDAEAVFTFPPGQPCFRASEHRISLERDPVALVRGGDWRGNPTGFRRVHVRLDDWVEDFAEHQDAIKRQTEGA